MSLVIDCHGHYTTAPKALENWRNAQIAGIKDPSVMPKAADLKISDDELNRMYIIPSVFNSRVVEEVRRRVIQAAQRSGVSRRQIRD